MRARIDRAIVGVAGAAVFGGAGVMLAIRGLAAFRVMAARAARRVAAVPGSIWRATVRAGRSLWRASREFARRTSDRFRRFFMERRHLGGALSSIIVNLYFIRKRASTTEGRKLVVVVDSQVLGSYLRGLASMRVLPRMRVVTLGTDEVGGWIEEFSRNGVAGSQLFIGRTLYVQHYSRFAEAGLAARTTVL